MLLLRYGKIIDKKEFVCRNQYKKDTSIYQKSPQVVKHVDKGEKWACSTLEAGKNKPVMFVAKTRDFKRFCEINKEKSGILRLPIFGLSDKT